ncbi:TetR/AcrR family transcriptional regulator [Demequina pelophila]|uniref:TetR/AcrR family transcriptional regulator n=1 Tax=Demequina pelophila TaxID=1638984 RepID=UPI000784CF77|nr:helix-turn-helix domain-containing protein [Demequina pelophila]
MREAILDAAEALFGEHGIRAVSADRILAEAGYSKVTFYRHFPSKDEVVVAYLERELGRVRAVLAAAAGETAIDRGASDAFGGVVERSAAQGLAPVAAALTDEMCRPHFRGCPFINAAAEYPDPDHPVRRVVTEFRGLMTGAIAEWARLQGVRDPGAVASQAMMLRDGALVAGYLSGDPGGVAEEFVRSLAAIVRAAGGAAGRAAGGGEEPVASSR